MPSLSAAQLNNEIVSLRKTVEAAKRFTIERLTRRTVPGNKKKDVRIERFKKEIEYIKKGLKTDEVTKFALVNTKSIDNLGITKTTPPSQSALYKVATATVLVEAIDKIRAKYPQWGKEIPFHLQRLGKTSLDAKLKKKDQKSKPASLKPSALVDDDEAEDAESDEAGSDVEMEEVDTDAEDEEEAEDVDEDIEADEDASPVKTNGAAKDNRLITTSDEDSDEDESFKVNKSGKITLADILRSKVAKLMSEDDEGFDGAEDFEDLDGLRHLIATAEDSDAEEELESESDEAMEVTPPKPVISTKKAGKLPPSKAAASTPDKYKTQHKEMIEAAKAIGAKKNSAKQAAKNGSKQPVVQPKGKQEPKNVQKTPADDKKQQKKKVTTPNVNVHEGKKYPSTPVPMTKSVAKKISLQAQESDDDDDSDEQVPVIKPQSKKRPVSKQQDSDEDESDDETSFVTPTAKKLKNAQGKAVAQKKQKPELSFDVGDDEEENDSEEEEKPKKSPGTKKEPKSRGFFKHQPPSVQNEREQQRHQRGNDEEGGGRRSFGGGNRGFSPRGDFRGGRGFGNRGGDRGGRGFGRGGGFGGGRGRGFNRDGDRGGRGFSRDGDRGGRGFSRGGSPGRGFGRGGGGFGGRGRGGDNDFRGGRGRGFGGGRGRGGEGGRGRGGFGGGGGGNHPSWEAKRQQRSQEQGAFAARGRGQRVTFDD